MTYKEAKTFLLEKLPIFSQVGSQALKKGLGNIKEICYILDNPQDKLPAIHIAGTNGKGSVAHGIAAILQKCGYQVGLYTSPHYVDFRERIKINGQYITEEAVIDFVKQQQKSLTAIAPSFFEVTTAMAFWYFARQKVDIAIIETGLGGRLDATNIITPILSVITNISLEHTKFLGDTLTDIATEKAGIIKKNVPVIIGETQKEVVSVFKQIAHYQQSDIIFADQHISSKFLFEKNAKKHLNIFLDQKLYISCLPFGLLGDYQLKNLLTIIQVCLQLQKFGWKIDKRGIVSGLEKIKPLTNLIGRWDILNQQPFVITDSGHNVAGIRLTMQQLSKLTTPQKKLHIVWGMLEDKELKGILSLLPKQATYYFCEPDSKRKLSVNVLCKAAIKMGLKGKAYPSIEHAILAAKKIAKPNETIYIGGSSFIASKILQNNFFKQ